MDCCLSGKFTYRNETGTWTGGSCDTGDYTCYGLNFDFPIACVWCKPKMKKYPFYEGDTVLVKGQFDCERNAILGENVTKI